MGTPELDEHGQPVPYDDNDIDDAHDLVRHICPIKHVHNGEISSSLFSTSSKTETCSNPGMSTNWKNSILDSGSSVEDFLPDNDHGIAELNVGQVRDLDRDTVKVGSTPIEGENPHHVDVWGVDTRGKRRSMKKMASYELLPSSLRED